MRDVAIANMYIEYSGGFLRLCHVDEIDARRRGTLRIVVYVHPEPEVNYEALHATGELFRVVVDAPDSKPAEYEFCRVTSVKTHLRGDTVMMTVIARYQRSGYVT